MHGLSVIHINVGKKSHIIGGDRPDITIGVYLKQHQHKATSLYVCITTDSTYVVKSTSYTAFSVAFQYFVEMRYPCIEYVHLNLNLNSLLVKRQTDYPSPGAVTGGDYSLALTREVNLDTLSSDSSEEEIRDTGRSFQSLMVSWKKLCYRHLY